MPTGLGNTVVLLFSAFFINNSTVFLSNSVQILLLYFQRAALFHQFFFVWKQNHISYVKVNHRSYVRLQKTFLKTQDLFNKKALYFFK